MHSLNTRQRIKTKILEFIEKEESYDDEVSFVVCEECDINAQEETDGISLDNALQKMQRLTLLGYKIDELTKTDGHLKNRLRKLFHKPIYFKNEYMSFISDLLIETLLEDLNASTKGVLSLVKEVADETKNELETSTIQLPTLLDTPRGRQLLSLAVEKGYLDENFQLKIKKRQATLLALRIGELLGIDDTEKWKPFAELWNLTNMAKMYQKMLEQKNFLEIKKKIFKDIC